MGNGGGIMNYGTVTNCTVYDNDADGYASNGGGIYNYDGTVDSCIVYGKYSH